MVLAGWPVCGIAARVSAAKYGRRRRCAGVASLADDGDASDRDGGSDARRGRARPDPDRDRDLERRRLPALRRAAGGGAAGSLLRPDAGVRTVLTRRRLRLRRGGQPAGAGAGGGAARGATAWSAPSATTSTGEPGRARRLPALHRPGAARARGVRGLPADGDRAQPRALRGRQLRRPPAAQPRPHRLHQRGGLGGDAGAARGGPLPAAGDRARPRQRLRPRPDRLPGALRRGDRLGDADPQPVRAVAGRAGAAGGRRARGEGDHPGRRPRRRLLGRRAARATASRPATTAPSGRRAGSRRRTRSWSGCGRSASATG